MDAVVPIIGSQRANRSNRSAAALRRAPASWALWATALVMVSLAACGPDTTPPRPVTNLTATATATATSVQLAWTNPVDDHSGTMVRRRLGTRAPSSPTDGTLVADVARPGATVTDRAVAASTTYTYAVFAHDAVPNYATGVIKSVITPPPDTTAPSPVTNVTVTATEASATLTWTNPTADHTGTLLRRAAGTAPPASPTEGTHVADVAAPGTTVTDTGLEGGATYSYALFAHDARPNHASAASATVTTPADATPPPPVTGLSSRATDTSVELRWSNPTGDYTGTTIRVAPGSVAPASPAGGTPVGEAPAPTQLFIDTGVRHSTTYTYAVFAHDAAANYASQAVTTVTTRPPSIILSSVELGRVAKPTSVVGRDGGASARLGATETWVFGDTIMNPPSCANENLHTATAAIGQPSDMTALTEPLDACGAPSTFLRFQGDEAYVGPCRRNALWPGSVVPDGGAGTGAVYVTRASFAQCGPYPDGYHGVEAVTVRSGETEGTRRPVLFGPQEPEFAQANVLNGYVYVYAELQPEQFVRKYKLARVPIGDGALYDRSAYTFYAGTDANGASIWSSFVDDAVALALGGVDGQANAGVAGVTVSWNPHLQKFLMVYAEFLGQNLVLRTADRPEGPWSTPSYLDVVDETSGSNFVYNGREHPSYTSVDGSSLALTYHSDGIRAVRVVLK
ncbi:hypothetical protein BH18ACT1_BH18ACT1_12950 [soil metagenome]